MKNFINSTFFLLPILLLLSCGYALRGSSTADLAPQLQTLQLNANNSLLNRAARQTLERNGITVIDTAQAGIYRLNIGGEQVSERVLSVNSDARAGEYELSLSATIQLDSNDDTILGPENLVTIKTYLADPNNAVAKLEEAELILREMRQSLVNQILRRLQSLTFEPSP